MTEDEQCQATMYERAVGHDTRCRKPAGHVGRHAPPFGNDRRDRTMRPHKCASCGRDIFENENGSLYEDLERHRYHTKESCLTRQRDDALSLLRETRPYVHRWVQDHPGTPGGTIADSWLRKLDEVIGAKR
jgi:hypothetical protein